MSHEAQTLLEVLSFAIGKMGGNFNTKGTKERKRHKKRENKRENLRTLSIRFSFAPLCGYFRKNWNTAKSCQEIRGRTGQSLRKLALFF
jgi:hypothetical protein